MFDNLEISGADLSERAMLVSLSIKQWTARKMDKRATDSLVETARAQNGSARVNKILVSRESIKEIQQAATAARTLHYELTLPWGNDGSRILPASLFERYSDGMRKARETFERSVDSFLGAYPAEREAAGAMLGELFDPDDYPEVAQIEKKFSWEVNIFPLPAASDFRVNLGAENVDAIKAQMEEHAKRTLETATRDAWDRLHKVVSRMAERLNAYTPATEEGRAQGVFRDSLVENVREAVEILPALNIGSDPDLDRMVEDARAALTKRDAATLREDDGARSETAKEAERIADAMGAFMGA